MIVKEMKSVSDAKKKTCQKLNHEWELLLAAQHSALADQGPSGGVARPWAPRGKERKKRVAFGNGGGRRRGGGWIKNNNP